MTRVVHLVVGPAEHGVVRHAELIARACGHEVVRAAALTENPDLPACDVVHVPFTDRLFAPDLAGAGDATRQVIDLVARRGAALSTTLHDPPHDDSPLQRRRHELYATLIAAARGVVVNSGTELALVQDHAEGVHSLRRIPLPIEELPASSPGTSSALPERGVSVLGFVYPDRGYEQVLAALPDDAVLVAVGRASDGHQDLVERYAEQAGDRWRLTGYLPDDELRYCLESAAVPIAPNRRVTASASINTWLACGRRPLVPDSAYGREIARDRPGTICLYDPDDPAALARRIRAALDDPASTRLPDGTFLGPSVEEVARIYLEHFAAVVPARAHVIGGTRLVPDNRWDLLPGAPIERLPTVSVVVPYYEAQHDLDLVLAALRAQTYPADLVQIVVADDGSARPPDLGVAEPTATRLVRQPDAGFRAAAARNLGARDATGELLVFLDGDTVPEPNFLRRLTDLPARCPDVVTVGRRRHADLSSVSWRDILGAGSLPDGAAMVDEPAWLADAYRRSADLLHADRRSYRYVISAVLAMDARLFAEVGGFAEEFVGYGGEDWELAHRLRTAGAVLAHVPTAIAWHNGPDWAGRGDAAARAEAKDRETTRLAAMLPDPAARGGGSGWAYPSVVVHAGSMRDVDALSTVRSAFAAGADCGFWFERITGPHADLVARLDGVHVGPVPVDVLGRAWCQAWLSGPCELSGLMRLAEHADTHGTISTPAVRLHSSRSLARTRRHAGGDERWAPILFGRHDRTEPSPRPVADLAAALRARAR